MNINELLLLKELVRRGFDMEYSGCCDDFDGDLIKDFTAFDIAVLSREFSAWNGDPENYDGGRFLRVGMRSAGKFLMAKLLKPLFQ